MGKRKPPTRTEAAGRLALALERCHLGGVTTNRDFLVATLRDPAFLSGDTTTDFIDRVGPARTLTLTDDELERAARLAAARARRGEGERCPSGRILREIIHGRLICLSAALIPAELVRSIGFDEGLKRYSYGPPVASARELLALIEAGIVDLRAVEDPDIRLVADGWQLAEGDARMRAPVMVDAVLPSPSLEGAADPILSRCARQAGPAPPSRAWAPGSAPTAGWWVRTARCCPG